jgi:hypothetical protein
MDMERLEDVLARQRHNLIADILLAVVLIITLGVAALSLGSRSPAVTGADNPVQVVHANHRAGATPAI